MFRLLICWKLTLIHKYIAPDTKRHSTPLDIDCDFTSALNLCSSVISPQSTASQIYSYLNFYDNYIDIFTKDLVNGYVRILEKRRATDEESVGIFLESTLEMISVICAQYLFDNSIKFDYIKESVPQLPGWSRYGTKNSYESDTSGSNESKGSNGSYAYGQTKDHGYMKLYDFISAESESVEPNDDDRLSTFCRISSNGLSYGYHEWSVKIMKCAGAVRQEMGVVSNPDLEEYEILSFENGIKNAFAFGARAIYGYKQRLKDDKKSAFYNYYASIDDDREARCYKKLSKIKQQRWKKGDIIKVCLNLRQNNITFYLNGRKVRKTISLQKGKVYYPVIAYTGDCEYRVMEFM